MRRVLRWVDPFVVALVATLAFGLAVPLPAPAQRVVAVAADVAVPVLFLVYGMRLSTREVLAGLRNVRLQGAILAATYLLFPALGLALHALAGPLVGPALADGLLYLSLLPSTVQSSVAFTSLARGNVAGAVCAATVSNVLGMVLTPVLVLLLMGRSGSVGLGGLRDVLLQLLVPFAVGQLLQPWAGGWVRARRWLTLGVDRGTILVVVLAAVTAATASGVWDAVSWPMVAALLGLSAVLLAGMLAATWWGGRALGLDLPDRVALLMCGSKKSLATGLPMAAVLFSTAAAATVAVPVILFHQLQLIVCAALARHLARRRPGGPVPPRARPAG
ncbi:bile acid:sodium symporter [Georgenia sp. TF02-10]|uniref:bile acid:sodium symporter family protein n=1 Tax=Georgenia sp. TF02-10 TaxID=2917725 RepID=UPI001FA6F4EC|nr:bile acid:sodium symporter family protein [Georgenia sp. TF02-10]UNX56176.1 bile acid:sodium symporter [Georgenia sp. TF02-10]